MNPNPPVQETGTRPPPSTGGRETGLDPFTPEGVSFLPVSRSLIAVRLAGAVIGNVLMIIGFLVPTVLVNRRFAIGIGLVLLVTLWEAWIIPRQVRAMGYALTQDHLLWRKGIMFRRLSVVPYGRMQYVDTSQGPLARWAGVAEVRLHTASASSDATINGLPVEAAERLRRLLAERGEQRMAGL